MRHIRLSTRGLIPMLAAAALWLAPSCGVAADEEAAAQASIAIVDFDYIDTSGEPRDQDAEHRALLAEFMRALKSDIAAKGRLRLVAPDCQPSPCALSGSSVPALLSAAREAGADILLIGGVHKMSTLIQWAKVDVIDVKTGRVLFDKLFSFRGDTIEAWRRAETFIAEEIVALPRS